MSSRTYQLKGKSLFTFVAILLVLALGVVGCGGQQQAQPADAAKTEQKTDAAAGDTRVIEHAMGKTEIKGTPQKIVVLTNEGTEAVLSMGVKPVGAVNAFTGGKTWYAHLEKDLEGVKPVGEELQPNLETIASLKPDLILGVKMRHEKIYDQLSAIAPTVFAETLRGDWKKNFTLYAKAINKEAEGEKVIADFDKKIEELKQKLGDKVKTKISLVRFMPGKTRIYYNDTFAGTIFKQIGLARPEVQNKDTFADEVTKERIPEMEGDIMFYFVYDKGDGEGTKVEQEWINDPLFKNLNVVKNNKAFKVNDTIWNTAGGVKAANLMVDELGKYLLEN